MRKTNFTWIFAMVLLVSLPAVYAQAFTANVIFITIVNALIIGIILFLLQAILVPGKVDKEKTAMWFIIIIASLLIAWFYGRGVFLWQGPLAVLFNIKILVNTIIIAAFLYFLLGILKIPQLGSTEGKTGYGILLFLVSVIIAVKVGNNWIWDQSIIQEAYRFLLNPNTGLLRGQRLWVFIGSFALLSFFFRGFLLKGGVGENKFVIYLLSLVLASSLASQGASLKAVIQMAEIFFVIMFAESLKGTADAVKGLNWGLALFLVAWVSAAATATVPEYRGLLGNVACGTLINCEEIGGQVTTGGGTTWGIIKIAMLFVGIPLILLWFMGGESGKKISGWGIGFVLLILLIVFIWTGKSAILKVGLILLIPLLLLGGIGYGIAKSERKWKFKEIKDRYGTLIWEGFRKKLARLKKRSWPKERIPPDRLPDLYRENIITLFSLSNYLKRLYIWYVKYDQVKDATKVCETMEKGIGIYLDFDKLQEEIYLCRNGGTIIDEDLGGKIDVGLFRAIEGYCLKMNELSLLLSKYVAAIIGGMEATKMDKDYNDLIDEFVNFKKVLTDALKPIKVSHQHLENRAKAYGNHMPVKAQRYLVLDQCNPYGDTAHEYKFVYKGTKLSDGSKIKEDKLEVNQYGEILDDINQDKETIRRIHIDEIRNKKIKELLPPHEMMEFIAQDWEGFIRSMRYGWFRFNSKYAFDYVKVLQTNKKDPNILGRGDFMPIFNYEGKLVLDKEQEKKIKFKPGWKSDENPAFDRRALVNTGMLKYPGRMEYDQKWNDAMNHPKKDGFPGVSSIGMGMYIPALTIRNFEDVQEAAKYLTTVLYDRGGKVTSQEEAAEIMGTLDEGIKQLQKEQGNQ